MTGCVFNIDHEVNALTVEVYANQKASRKKRFDIKEAYLLTQLSAMI